MEIEEKYAIHPILMMGKIKHYRDETVTINLRGRLGLITVSDTLINSKEPIHSDMLLEFYFSYIQVTSHPLDYDQLELLNQEEVFPCLLGGKISHVDDTAVRVQLDNELGNIYVPRRWIFTSVDLVEGLDVEFYLSKMNVKK